MSYYTPLPHSMSTPARPIPMSTGQPRSRPPLGTLSTNGPYTLPPPLTTPSRNGGISPLKSTDIFQPFSFATPSPTCNISRNSNYTASSSIFSFTMQTPRSDDSCDEDAGISAEQRVKLAGIKPPARFPGGVYPEGFKRKDPVPDGDKDGKNKAPSQNPWDYLEKRKIKERRRFDRRELEAIEVLWSVLQSPNKYQRQRLGSWLGVPTKHITVWFQNKRQESRKHAKDQENQHPDTPHSESQPRGRGTYDPSTGKWRPVDASCIAAINPPPKDKAEAMMHIVQGEFDRDDFLGQVQQPLRTLPLPRPVLGRARPTGTLEQIMADHHDNGQRRKKTRTEGFVLPSDEQESKHALTNLMSSSPVSLRSSPVNDREAGPSQLAPLLLRPSTPEDGSPPPRRKHYMGEPPSLFHRQSFDRADKPLQSQRDNNSSLGSTSPPTPGQLDSNHVSFDQNALRRSSDYGNGRHPSLGYETLVYSAQSMPRIPPISSEREKVDSISTSFAEEDSETMSAANCLLNFGSQKNEASQTL